MMGVEGDPVGIVQEIKIRPYNQMVYAHTKTRSREWDAKNYLGFGNTNGSPNPDQKTRLSVD